MNSQQRRSIQFIEKGDFSLTRLGALVRALAGDAGRPRGVVKALSISVINQTVSSGTNFVLALILVRWLTPFEFGLYGIGFAVTLLCGGIADALFLTQMVIHVPDKDDRERLPYAARILAALGVFLGVSAAIVLLLLVPVGAWSQLMEQYFGLAVSIIAASIGYILKDFFVRHSYTARREVWALWVHATAAVILAGVVLLQHQGMRGLSAQSALWAYALASIGGAIVGFILARLPMSAVRPARVLEDVREAWVGGRWALGGVLVTWLQTQAYVYLTALLAGPVGVGLINAARILVTPVLFLVPPLMQLAIPRFSTLRVTNHRMMGRACILFSGALVLFATVYSATLIGIGEVLAHALIGKFRYQDVSPLLAAWCLFVIFQFSRVGAVIYLQVTKQFKSLMLLNSLSLLVALLAAVFLMQVVGLPGAILGSAVGELVLSVLLYRVATAQYRRAR